MKTKFLFTSFIISILINSILFGAKDWNQTLKITASDRDMSNQFGRSVAIDGNFMVIGSTGDSDDETGMNYKSSAGSAYIFENQNGNWTEVQKICASDRQSSDGFGISVSISGDYIIVGAKDQDYDAAGNNSQSEAGAAYIFHNTGETWEQVQKIVASDRTSRDYFGCSVAICNDFILVGAYNEEEDASGMNTVNDAGSAYLFKNNSGTWTQTQKIVAPNRFMGDYFGYSVSISYNNLVVGAYGEDEDANENNYLGGAGSAYIFSYDGDTWNFTQKIVASDRSKFSNFATVVSIYGDNIIIGTHKDKLDENGENSMDDAGSAYIFEKNGGSWTQSKKLTPSFRTAGDHSGGSVDIDSSYAVVGTYGDKEDQNELNEVNFAGSVSIYKKGVDGWTLDKKIVPTDREASDFFGMNTAIYEDFIVTATTNEDHDLDGLNNQSSAGSAYIISTNPLTAPSTQATSVSFSNVAKTQLDISWTKGNGSRVVVFMKQAAAGTAAPVNNTLYTPNTFFAGGSQIGSSGWFCIYKGTGNSVSVNTLVEGQNYIVHVIEMNGTIGTEIYQSSTASGNPFTGASLPVELTSFSATVSKNVVTLNWATATEINNYGFEVERQKSGTSSQNSEWKTVGFVDGNGNSNSPKSYSFRDKNFESGNVQYRLKQIDNDGSFEYSEIIEVSLNNAPERFELSQNYPNPFNPATKIKYSVVASGTNGNSSVLLKVYDVLGNEVAVLVDEEKPAGNYEVIFDATNLSSGTYFYKLTSGNYSKIKKMILMK